MVAPQPVDVDDRGAFPALVERAATTVYGPSQGLCNLGETPRFRRVLYNHTLSPADYFGSLIRLS